MNRLEFYKQELEKKVTNGQSVAAVFQELNNMLPTYKEKKEFADYFHQLFTEMGQKNKSTKQ